MTGARHPIDCVQGLLAVRQRIEAAARLAGRAPDDIRLVVVSKTFGPDRIEPLLAAGHRLFGENRVQEALAKWPDLRRSFSGIELHLIGPLQSNKAADAVSLFDCIQSIDRPKLALAVAREMDRQGVRREVFVQINTGCEAQKAGVMPEEADRFLGFCRDDARLAISGLMCIPPVDEDPVPHFRLLGQIARRHALEKLSMGMSGDFETAIREGATHVRVGSAIFGHRGARPV
jgi:pyridoxal phosphate enzyme (YggS family)